MYAGITDYLLNDRLGERKKLECEYAKSGSWWIPDQYLLEERDEHLKGFSEKKGNNTEKRVMKLSCVFGFERYAK